MASHIGEAIPLTDSDRNRRWSGRLPEQMLAPVTLYRPCRAVTINRVAESTGLSRAAAVLPK